MRIPLYISEYDDRPEKRAKRASHLGREVDWSTRVPQLWRGLTIGPIWVDVNRDLDAGAERWMGYDEEESPCYCRYRFEVDIGSLAESAQAGQVPRPGYVEDLAAWRMRDGRWLIHRIIMCHADGRKSYDFYAFSESMPR
jgi:hypothetical protein